MSWIDKDETIKEIMGQPTEPHYPDWYAAIVREMPELSCDGCVYNVDGMLHMFCGECMRAATDKYRAKGGR